jgi:hypothetical protein
MRSIWAGLGGAVILLIIVLIRTKPTEKIPTTLPPPASIKPTVVPPPSSHTPELTQPTGSLSPQVPRVTEPQSYSASETGLDDVIPQPSRSGASYNNDGLDLCKRHDFQGALEAFKCAVKLRPENPEYWNNVGYAYQELQRYETSNYFCFKALALSPNRTAAFGNIAYNYAKLRKEDEAVDYWTRYLRSFQSEGKRDRSVAFPLQRAEVPFRPPYGQRTVAVTQFAGMTGDRVVLWNIDSLDWNRELSADRVRDRVVTLMLLWRKGIILFHDTHPKVIAVLPGVVETFRGSGIIWVNYEHFPITHPCR